MQQELTSIRYYAEKDKARVEQITEQVLLCNQGIEEYRRRVVILQNELKKISEG